MDKLFSEKREVNGIKMDVTWVPNLGYEMYIGSIDTYSEEAKKRGIVDEVTYVGKNPEKAKDVFEYAKILAELGNNPYDIMEKVEEYVKNHQI